MMNSVFSGFLLDTQSDVIDLVFVDEINSVCLLNGLLKGNRVFHYIVNQISFLVFLILKEELFLAPKGNDST